jgi:hypothetical protein
MYVIHLDVDPSGSMQMRIIMRIIQCYGLMRMRERVNAKMDADMNRDKMLVVVLRKIMLRGCRGLRYRFLVSISKRNPKGDQNRLICGVSGHS